MVGTQKALAACSHLRTMEKTTTAVQMLTVVGCGALPRKTTTRTTNGVTVEVSEGVLEFTPSKRKRKNVSLVDDRYNFKSERRRSYFLNQCITSEIRRHSFFENIRVTYLVIGTIGSYH